MAVGERTGVETVGGMGDRGSGPRSEGKERMGNGRSKD